jgi:hypothetical protein
MRRSKTEALITLQASLARFVDPILINDNFLRTKKGLAYINKLDDCTERIHISPRRPIHSGDTMEIYIAVNVVIELASVNSFIKTLELHPKSLQWDVDATIYQPIGKLKPKQEFIEWKIATDEDYSDFCSSFLDMYRNHIVDFLSFYKTPTSIVEGFLRSDPRLPIGRGWIVRVIVCCLIIGKFELARDLAMQSLDKPGLRQEYAVLIDRVCAPRGTTQQE